MKIPVYTLGNNSHQPVSVNYQAGTTTAVGDVAQSAHGLLTISPGKKVVIEQSRVNYGQIHNLSASNSLTVTSSYVTSGTE
jgi:hypothetical protein